jgi:hypothetical protein
MCTDVSAVASAKARTVARSLHTLVLVLFGSSVPLAVIDADVKLGALTPGPETCAHIARSRDETFTFGKHRTLHTGTGCWTPRR